MISTRKVILYIASSLDGYIAKPNDDLSFLQLVAVEGEDYGYAAFKETVDTVLMGRKTFDWVWKEIGAVPHPELDTYIVTRTPRTPIGKTQFWTGDLSALVRQLKTQPGKHIYCDGGAEIVQALLREQLIDEMIISVVPVLLGSGTKLFKEGYLEQTCQLLSAKSFASGLVQLHYSYHN